MLKKIKISGLLLLCSALLIVSCNDDSGDGTDTIPGEELDGTWAYNAGASTGPDQISSFDGLTVQLTATENGINFSFSSAPNADVIAQSGTFTISSGSFDVNQTANLSFAGNDFDLQRTQEDQLTLNFTVNTSAGRFLGIDGNYALVFDRQ
jgi:hypothetical protein